MDPGRMNLCRGGPFGPPFAFSGEPPGVSENRVRNSVKGIVDANREPLTV